MLIVLHRQKDALGYHLNESTKQVAVQWSGLSEARASMETARNAA
jgi:hypothetical protein